MYQAYFNFRDGPFRMSSESLPRFVMKQIHLRIMPAWRFVNPDRQKTREYMEHRLLKVVWKTKPTFDQSGFKDFHQAINGIAQWVNFARRRLVLHCQQTGSSVHRANQRSHQGIVA